MFDNDGLSIDCATCIGSGTTACTDCVVTHLLANDDGPIGVVPAPVGSIASDDSVDSVDSDCFDDPVDLAISRLARAGLLDERPRFVTMAEFDSYGARGRSSPLGVR